MAAPKGNQFWKARAKHGRDKIFQSPDDLWKACEQYFEWVDSHPLYEDKVFSYQGTTTHVPVAKMRAMTIKGLCLFLGISQETWGQYRKDKDFSEVCTRVEMIIQTQKFEGAAADLLNANIIARDLELKDKAEMEHSGGLAHQIKVVFE